MNNSCFPRRAPLPGQASFTPYNPGADAPNMDDVFPHLSKFLFTNDEYKNAEIYLFQPGRKKVHGYIEKGYDALLHAIHIPEKFDSVEEMLYALNKSCKKDKPPYKHTSSFGSFPMYNWFGVNIFPPDTVSDRYFKYKLAEDSDLNKTVSRRGIDGHQKYIHKFLETFPKCAAAAGYNEKGKPSKSYERGWIVYRNRMLMVCRGDPKDIKHKHPSPGVCDGFSKHEPLDEIFTIVGKVNIRVKSLQELFCAAEALW